MQTKAATERSKIWSVITASSVGTLIEWYDFYIFGSLATILSEQFFPKDNPTAAFLSTLATFAAGFVVRPFGALVFGRLGDIVGRKYTFLLTLVLMGGSTFAIGLIPGYASIGVFAPLLVLLLRLIQGLALGGEYGGAATYVAEHSPAHRRGYFTSFIQTTATLGLFVSLGVILGVKNSMGAADFASWGWRIPFILSIFLVAISIYIRMKMEESPLFAKAKAEGKTSSNPLKESFTKKGNLKMVLLALFGATAGQGVIWYTGQFYAMSFIEKNCAISFDQTRYITAIALIIGTPFFILFGAWSDKIGRKAIMMVGMFLAILAYQPIYHKMYELADIKTKQEIPSQKAIETQSDISTGIATTTITHTYTDGTLLKETKKEKLNPTATDKAEIKQEKVLATGGFWMMVFLVAVQVIFVTMVYGPIAAFLVELFPTRIRYTSMSLPYHIGNGIFGGLTPFIATFLYESSKTQTNPAGDPFAGLWYPIGVAAVCVVIGTLYVSGKFQDMEH
ncbi:MFS transporter [Cytophagaceae bacterium DM2B3-1]|uniref:MFS transporter n=1 Tax=Xanthocytophaga flava TaxID=3048013 RepID=A0ABT7CGD7_9BACT|nr:MFS transporter [Xanthocytophaga flavus]MDJ1492810.1 MFS transporter [Xanthocytophaga flavus]